MNTSVKEVAERVQWHMDAILSLFRSGRKITVLVRSPDMPTADFCMTNDDLAEVRAMVDRRIADGGAQ